MPMRFRIAPSGRRLVLTAALGASGVGVGVVVLGAAAGCDKLVGRGAATQPAMPAMPAASVTVSQAKAQDVPFYIEEIGTTAAREYVAVQSQVAGQVQQIHFTDGQELKKGEMLFTIDPRPFQAAVAQAEANVGQRRAELELARQDFARVQELIKTKAISQQEFDQKKNAVDVSEAQVKAADAAVQTAKLNLDYCYVRSPIDGRAGQRQVDVGNVVKVNDMTLLVIQRLDPIYADFTITERDLPRVREHMKNGRTLKAEVWVPDADAAPREGDLTFLDTAVQTGSGRVKLRATVPNEDRHFWAGQFVNVRLVLEVKKDAVLVPSQAIQIGQAGPYVYVVEGGKTAAMRPIKQGQRQDGWVVISDGVKAGENVVTTGQKFLFPGAPVAISPGQAPGAGAPAEASTPPSSGEKPTSQQQKSQQQQQPESKSSAKTSSSEGVARS